jgi:hypothetical protein
LSQDLLRDTFEQLARDANVYWQWLEPAADPNRGQNLGAIELGSMPLDRSHHLH